MPAQILKRYVDFNNPVARLYLSFMLMLTMFGVGIVGYSIIGQGEWSLLDCAYMTVITLTTVGYGEIVDISHYPAARVFTMVLILMGMGTILFFVSSMTAFVVEGQLQDILRRKRMKKAIEHLEDHVIICGLGETGLHITSEMLAIHKPVVLIDMNEERLRNVCETLQVELPYIVGDATDDHVLMEAGVMRASGLIAAGTEDKDNAFIIVSAKQLNSGLRIVTKAISVQSERKLRRIGADRVVTTTRIGGLRMASEMLRPTVTTFLDRMMRDQEVAMRIEEVDILPGSPFIGKSLIDLDIRRMMDLTVIAIENKKERKYHFNPEAMFVLQDGLTLICLGAIDSIVQLRRMAKPDK